MCQKITNQESIVDVNIDRKWLKVITYTLLKSCQQELKYNNFQQFELSCHVICPRPAPNYDSFVFFSIRLFSQIIFISIRLNISHWQSSRTCLYCFPSYTSRLGRCFVTRVHTVCRWLQTQRWLQWIQFTLITVVTIVSDTALWARGGTTPCYHPSSHQPPCWCTRCWCSHTLKKSCCGMFIPQR